VRDITESLDNAREYFEPGVRCKTDEGEELMVSSAKWADASLRTFTGDLLQRALGISTAISEFVSELER